MNDLRVEILRRRLDHIMTEWPSATDGQRDTLISEAMLIWRDIRAKEALAFVATALGSRARAV